MLIFLILLFCLTMGKSASDLRGKCSQNLILNRFVNDVEQEKYARARKQWCSLYPYYMRGICRQGGEVMSPFNQLGPPGPRCQSPLETYGLGDSAKRVCSLGKLIEYSEEESTKSSIQDCWILSAGSRNQWSFEQDIYGRIETLSNSQH